MSLLERSPWAVSLHGGHSRDYCDHADSTLREILDAALAAGYRIYGVTEHAPRDDPRFLYPEEIKLGWDVPKIQRDFAAYARETQLLAGEYAGRLLVLRGFEAEVVPWERYVDITLDLRARHHFDYVVGSVHWIDDRITDYSQESFDVALREYRNLEAMAVHYYERVAAMVRALRPEVVGHLDVIRKYARPHGPVDTPAIRDAADGALEAIRDAGSILDINTAAYRKGFDTPYPAPWLLERAVHHFGIGVCFGDDSHGVAQVGAGILEARAYLLDHGVGELVTLERTEHGLERRHIPL
ncbi:MAG TPA: histidinol-phosphatase [Candidatus Hydrogenedentes bacterium]|nr:histidinol-phosphatase [Candidatus Hydrogenedentota bacterium]